MILSLIAAVSKNGVIGVRNQLPWRLPGDLKRFKAITVGKPCLMGRKTFESIGKPLPGRENWVVTRDPSFRAPDGVQVRDSLDDVLRELEARNAGDAEVFGIGGGEIYRALLPRADRLYLTRVDVEIEGDAFFPEWDVSNFREISSEAGEGTPVHRFLIYERTES